MMRFDLNKCPTCGKPPKGTLETLKGCALFFTPSGESDDEFDYAGETEVYWDEQQTHRDLQGRATLICADGHDWRSGFTEDFSNNPQVSLIARHADPETILTEAVERAAQAAGIGTQTPAADARRSQLIGRVLNAWKAYAAASAAGLPDLTDRVLVIVGGGVVQEVIRENTDIAVTVHDYDVDSEDLDRADTDDNGDFFVRIPH